MSDNYKMMKTWLIETYGGPSRIVGDIVGDLLKKGKPCNNIKQKFSFFSAITGAIQRLERLARVSYINGTELEACLLSRSTLSGLISLLPSVEHDLWVREMTLAQLDFRNLEGLDTFNFFKRIYIIEKNTNENFREEIDVKNVQSPVVKKLVRSTYKVEVEKRDSSNSESEVSEHGISKSNPRPWKPSPSLIFPCPIYDHDHEISQCTEFFKLNPTGRWATLLKGRICYTCMKPQFDCHSRKCIYSDKVPETPKCAHCALLAASKGLTPFIILFCRHKYHKDTRAPLSVLKTVLEGYIGKLRPDILDSTIGFSVDVNFLHVNSAAMESEVTVETGYGAIVFPQAPIIDSETGYRVTCKKEDICAESSDNSIYLMQNLRVGNSYCLTFFDSGANAHLMDGRMARQEELQLISNKSIALGVIGGGSIKTEFGSFRFNLGPGEDGKYHELTAIGMESVTAGFGKYDLKEIIKEYKESATSEELE